MKASDIMSKEVYIVSPKDNVATVRKLLLKKEISRVLVYENEPLGIITERNLSDAFLQARKPIDQLSVSEVMTPKVISASPDDTPQRVAEMMVKNRISGVPVVSEGEVLGIITKTDLLKFFSRKYRNKVQVKKLMTPDVVTTTPYHSIFHAIRLMDGYGIKKLVIVEDKQPVGMLTERDLAFIGFGVRPSKMIFLRPSEHGVQRVKKIYPMIVADAMKRDIVTVAPDTDAAEGADLMLKNKIGSLLVTDGKGIAGIVTKTDYTRHIAATKEPYKR